MTRKKTIVTAALGTAFAASLAAAPIANAAQNPFGMDSLQSGYQIVQNKANEGKCGEDKDKEGKCGEGKCGGAK
jgi:uncharacterized low-complexity protein